MAVYGQELLGSRGDAEWPGDRSVAKMTTSDPERAEHPGKHREMKRAYSGQKGTDRPEGTEWLRG